MASCPFGSKQGLVLALFEEEVAPGLVAVITRLG
jgi:hypothetical protein